MVQSDAAEKRLFNHTIEAIDYYWPVRPLISTELLFLWLAQLSPLIGLATDPNYTKSKSFSNNCSKSNSDISDGVDSEEFVTKEKLGTKEEFGIEYLKGLE